jgi:hypothetical protein
MRGGRRHSRGWAQGPQFPGAGNTGATATAVTTTNVSGGATSGTGWSWNGTTCTVTGSVTGLNVAGPISITGASATVSNCVASATSAGITIAASGVTVTTCTAPSILMNTGGLSDITIEQCTVACANGECIEMNVSTGAGVTGLTIRDCTLSGLDAGAGRTTYGVDDNRGNTDPSMLIQGCNIYWCRDAFNLTAATIQGCYVHDFGYVFGDHTDGVANGGTGGEALTILGNSILMNHDETSPLILGGTAFLQNVTIAGNLLAGGDYCIYAGLQSTDNLRTDTSCSISGGTTLNDAALIAGDAGATVTDLTTPANIPAFTTIGTPSGGTATLSQACTNSSSQHVQLHFTSGIVISGNRFSRMFYQHAGTFAPCVDYDSTVASNVWDAGNVFHDDWTSAPS